MHIVAGRPVTLRVVPKSGTDDRFRRNEQSEAHAYYNRESKNDSAAIAAWCFAGCLGVLVIAMVASVTMSVLDVVLRVLGIA